MVVIGYLLSHHVHLVTSIRKSVEMVFEHDPIRSCTLVKKTFMASEQWTKQWDGLSTLVFTSTVRLAQAAVSALPRLATFD